MQVLEQGLLGRLVRVLTGFYKGSYGVISGISAHPSEGFRLLVLVTSSVGEKDNGVLAVLDPSQVLVEDLDRY